MIHSIVKGYVVVTDDGLFGLLLPGDTMETSLEDSMEIKPYGPHTFGTLLNGWVVIMLKQGHKTWCTHIVMEHEGRAWYSAVTESLSPRGTALEAGLRSWIYLGEKHGVLAEGKHVRPR